MMPIGLSHHSETAKFVEKQMRNWELVRSQRPAGPAPPKSAVEDFVYLSAQAGAGVGEVADRLGQALGWPVFDKELLHAMAGDDAVRERLYKSMDERDVSWFEETLRSIFDQGFVKNDFFQRLSRTVLSIARQGHAVFVGRAAGFILPADVGLRVRLVAPLPVRVAHHAKVEGLGAEQARMDIEQRDRERAEFVRAHFRRNIEEVLQFDLVLNMAKFTSSRAAELILTARKGTCG